jgi:protein-S-isoprenylcysteine O-methyltransferase Ste14
MTALLIACFFCLHASFAWGRVQVFRIDGATPPGVRLIEGASAASIATGALLIATRTAPHALFDPLALLCALASAALFAWGVHAVGRRALTAAFSDDSPQRLLTHGPFCLTRNPFYTAYLLGHALPLLATRSAWALPALGVMAAIYVAAVHVEERKFLASPLADDWRAYAARTGRFLPWPLPRFRPPSQPPTNEETT